MQAQQANLGIELIWIDRFVNFFLGIVELIWERRQAVDGGRYMSLAPFPLVLGSCVILPFNSSSCIGHVVGRAGVVKI